MYHIDSITQTLTADIEEFVYRKGMKNNRGIFAVYFANLGLDWNKRSSGGVPGNTYNYNTYMWPRKIIIIGKTGSKEFEPHFTAYAMDVGDVCVYYEYYNHQFQINIYKDFERLNKLFEGK